MTSRVEFIVRAFFFFSLIAVSALAPAGCVGCGSDHDVDLKDPISTQFPLEASQTFSADTPFVPIGAERYGFGEANSGEKAPLAPLDITLPVEGANDVRFEGSDGFVVVFRSLDQLGRAVLSEGIVTYEGSEGGQVWTAKDGGLDVTLFSKREIASEEPFRWSWEVSEARVKLKDADVAVVDDKGVERLRFSIRDAKNSLSKETHAAFSVVNGKVTLEAPKDAKATIVRTRFETLNATKEPPPEGDAPNGSACTMSSDCDSTFCVDGVCCNSTCTNLCFACSTALKGQGINGTCGPIIVNTDPENECASGACNGAGACKLDNAQSCAAGSDCLSGQCVDGVCCDSACTATCFACTVARKGQGVDGVCGPIKATLDPDSECPSNSACNGAGACKFNNGQGCATGGQCVSTICVDTVCCDTVCTGICKSCNIPGKTGTCSNVAQNQNDPLTCAGATQSCDGNGLCKSDNGEGCTQGSDCISGFCVDGVCCNSACGTVCSGCAVPGSVGSCSPIPNGNDDFFPTDACVGADKSCNGAGACKRITGSSCTTGTECSSGFCVDDICCSTSSCGNCKACNVTGNKGTCWNLPANSSDPDASPACTGTTACDGSGTCKKLNGVACTNGDGTQCISGFCVDNVCCNAACNGTCQACSTTKKGGGINGDCGDVANGTDPDAECQAQAISTCGNTGVCSNGACQQYPAGSTCVAAYCSPDGLTQFNTDICNGSGTCNDGGSKPCIPYVCSSNACLTACSSQLHCNVTAYCDGATSTCVYKKVLGAQCGAAVECVSGQCVDGVCCESSCAGECKVCNSSGACVNVATGVQDNTCQAQGQACDGTGICKKSIGLSCTVSTECLSNFCRDGYCCDTDCASDCQACSVAKKGAGNQKGNGYCENVATGTDPNNNCAPEAVTTCGNDGFCDGMGQCRKYDNTKICDPSSCLDDHTLKGPNKCDGVGFCLTGETDCSPYVCKTNACKTTCATNADCIADAYCATSVCMPKKADGQACANGGQCLSANCVDGVCCGAAMCPDCQACNLSGNGTCSPVPSGTKDGVCSTADKACDGLGTCKKVNGQSCAGTADCVTDNCVDGVCCNNACKTPCQACNVAGNVGICSNVPSGQDDSTCTGADVACDGNGECKKELGQTCSSPTECLVGKCVDGVCCNTDCTETCKACNLPNSLGLCSFVPENGKDPMTCDASTVSCNGGGECVKALGEVCTMDGECSSKHCADGVCCDVQCGIDCKSCNVQGSVGICTDVPENEHDGVCTNGKACNGSGKCMIELGQKCGVGTQCLSGYCFNQVCCDAQCSGSCQACSIAAGATADGACTALSNKPCDDGNFCTQTDVCQSGTCVGDNPVVCAEAGECQNEGECNPTSGICEYSDQGPECTAGKNTTGGGCVCSLTGERTSNHQALVGIVGLLVAAAFRKRNKRASANA